MVQAFNESSVAHGKTTQRKLARCAGSWFTALAILALTCGRIGFVAEGLVRNLSNAYAQVSRKIFGNGPRIRAIHAIGLLCRLTTPVGALERKCALDFNHAQPLDIFMRAKYRLLV